MNELHKSAVTFIDRAIALCGRNRSILPLANMASRTILQSYNDTDILAMAARLRDLCTEFIDTHKDAAGNVGDV